MSQIRAHSPPGPLGRLSKRFKLSHRDPQPDYLRGMVPSNLIRSERPQIMSFYGTEYFLVDRNYDSRILGNPNTTMFHFAIDNSEWTPQASREWLQVIRTHHTTLKLHDYVYFGQIRRGYYAWVVRYPNDPQLSTHAAGVPIHVQLPSHTGFLTPNTTTNIGQPLADFITGAPVDATTFLTSKDIQFARTFCPRAIALQVLVVGEVRALYESFDDIEKDWDQHKKFYQFGTCPFTYAVDTIECTRPPPPTPYSFPAPISYGQQVAAFPISALPKTPAQAEQFGQLYARGCVGLKIKLTEGILAGQEFITTVTHAWVYRNGSPGLFDFFSHGLNKIGSTINKLFDRTIQGRLGSTPVGQEVYIDQSNTKIGTIIRTYDGPISQRTSYPEGFTHDLALISADANSSLPDVRPPVNRPRVTGWASLRAVMQGDPLFVMQTNVTSTLLSHTLTAVPLAPPTATEENVGIRETRAVYEGYEIRFAKKSSKETPIAVAFLWRTSTQLRARQYLEEEATLKSTLPDTVTAEGFSGSILCLGKPTDAECKAVVFQNYQEPFRYPFSKAVDQRLDKEGKVTIKVNDPDQKIDKTRLMGWPVAWYKAGFLLPKEIQSSRILMEKRVITVDSNSVPLAGRHGRHRSGSSYAARNSRSLELAGRSRDGYLTD